MMANPTGYLPWCCESTGWPIQVWVRSSVGKRDRNFFVNKYTSVAWKLMTCPMGSERLWRGKNIMTKQVDSLFWGCGRYSDNLEGASFSFSAPRQRYHSTLKPRSSIPLIREQKYYMEHSSSHQDDHAGMGPITETSDVRLFHCIAFILRTKCLCLEDNTTGRFEEHPGPPAWHPSPHPQTNPLYR